MNKTVLTIGIVIVVVIVAYFAFAGSLMVDKSKTDVKVEQSETMMKEEPTGSSMMEDSKMATGSMMEGNVKTFTIEASPFKFTPNVMKVKKGDTVRVTFKNVQGTHDFTLEEFDVVTEQLSAGQQEVVEFTASKAGTFEFYCSVGNHRAMGLTGTLVVE